MSIFSSPGDRRRCNLYLCDTVPYPLAWGWQRHFLQQRLNNPNLDDVLILLEHPPVYTLGQGASWDFVKFDPHATDAEIYRVERGGEVTYHCPGQLVGYPILNLRYYKQDLHWYLRQLEEVLIQAIAGYGLVGDRLPGMTGVWVEGRKVAAIGIKVSRWVTIHGFSLNISPQLAGFSRIVPCGIADKPIGSLAEFIPDINFTEVRSQVAAAFSVVFGVDLISTNLPEDLPVL